MLPVLQLLARQLSDATKLLRYLFYGYLYPQGFPVQPIWAVRVLLVFAAVIVWFVWPQGITPVVIIYLTILVIGLLARLAANILVYFKLVRPATKDEKNTVAEHVRDATPPPIRQPIESEGGWD